MIKVGVIGCGKIAQVRHLPEYANNKDVQIKGLYDLNVDRATELAKLYNAKVYDSYQSMIEDEEIDAVSVCVANNAHAEVTNFALLNGKHVLCEKPMAMNIDDCMKMVETSKKTGNMLMIAQNQRLAPAHVKAKELLDEGVLGEVITFKTNFGHSGPETWGIDSKDGVWFFDKEKAVMGVMADLGIHKTDLIQFLLGQKIVETTATVTTINKKYSDGSFIGVDDNAICIYKMENGVIGTMTSSWSYYGEEDNSTIIYGTKGIMKIYADPIHTLIVIDKDGNRTNYDTGKIQTNDNQTVSGVIDLFVDSIVNKKPSPISSESVCTAMNAVFGSIKSSETSKTVFVNN